MSKENKFLERKRTFNEQIKLMEDINISEKIIHSAEVKKRTYFIADLDPQLKEEEINPDEKLSGKKLNMKYRRKKAFELYKHIVSEDDEITFIKNALSYDNTKKYWIYRLLKYYRCNDDKPTFTKALKKYKFCITKRFNVFEGEKEINVDLNKFYEITESIDELEELPEHKKQEKNIIDLRNSLVSLFTDYFYLADYLAQCKLNKDDLSQLLEIKIIKNISQNSEPIFYLDYEIDKKRIILNKYGARKKDLKEKTLKTIKNFLFKYIYMKEFENFRKNQAVSFNNNLTLYYNYFMYSLYEMAIEPDELEEKIKIKSATLKKYNSLKELHNIIFDDYFDQEIEFNETINQLLQYLFFLLGTDDNRKFYNATDFILLEKNNTFFKANSVQKLINKLNDNNEYIKAKKVKGKIIFDESPSQRKIEIDYRNYSEKILDLKDKKLNILWEHFKFENFQKENFFLENDIRYLKFLIKYILSSPLFKEIFDYFSRISSIADYYFLDDENINEYIDSIIFLPFKVSNTGRYAITNRDLLSVLVSGLTEKEICGLNEYRIFRIMELAQRSIILSDHEPSHYLKGVYSIITERKVSRYTSKDDKSIDSGSFLEEVLFGWIHNPKNTLDLSEFKIPKDIQIKNKALQEKTIDLATALKLLNPEIYTKNLAYFRKSIYETSKADLEQFSFNNLDDRYKSYLQTVIDEKTIKNYSNSDISVEASKSSGGFSIKYIQCNHNAKN